MSHLRIVGLRARRMCGAGPGTAPTSLTVQQQDKVRAALKNLRFRYGGWDVLAGVMGIHVGALSKIAHRHWPVTAEVLLRACRRALRGRDAERAPLGYWAVPFLWRNAEGGMSRALLGHERTQARKAVAALAGSNSAGWRASSA
jgi:hypothetical protein